MSLVDPAGPRAAATANLWWFMFALGLAVYVLVIGLLGVSLLSRRRLHDDTRTRVVVIGGFAAPAVILLVLMAANLYTLVAVAAPSRSANLTLDVVGHQWWWEVRYPDQQFATANEIHIPTNATVVIHLSSADVIHSLWVPRLAGKTDLVPGQNASMWLQADVAGEYRGQCAEYCGIEHAQMAFVVVAQAPDQFQQWVASQAQPATPPTESNLARGAQAFASLGCINCHAIRYGGATPTGGGIGPDLTHIASRNSIAAGAAANDPDTLERWIANPASIKKGATMPPTSTDPDTLRALVSYLASLK